VLPEVCLNGSVDPISMCSRAKGTLYVHLTVCVVGYGSKVDKFIGNVKECGDSED
jgi:hypothetical protein